MRLEIEPTVAAPQVSDDVDVQDHVAEVSAEVKSMLNQGIKAAQAGNRSVARIALQRTTELDPRNESAWLWLASISEYPEELLGFLNHVLEINPQNQRATEWKTATNALLSRTFVQRGIDACEENQREFGAECFQTALQYDEKNATAYMWMASLAEASAVKVSFLEKALEIEPGNEAAMNALDEAKKGIVKERLTEAKSAVVSGNNAEAINILDSLLAVTPDSVEAWTMKSHLADGFDEKIRCFENILAIDPENVAARSGRDSLLSIFGTMEAAEAENTKATEVFDSPLVERYAMSIDKSPTQDLELPEGIQESSFHAEPETSSYFETTPEEENVNDTMQNDAEPFASYAEEVQEPAHFDFASVSATETEPAMEEDETEAPAFADPQGETVAFSYDESQTYSAVVDDEGPTPSGEFEIPMPVSELPVMMPETNGFETKVETRMPEPEDYVSEPSIEVSEVMEVKPESVECMFCHQSNEPQSISCRSCMAVLTLSDLELLLANQNADKLILRQAVEDMERKRSGRDATVDELVALGLGHLNLRNLKLGYTCLADASKLDPNNVVLSGQVNSLLIRLDEIKQQEEAHLRMPKGKTILVVDDSPTVRKLIAGKLEKSGHDVICANDGVEAMESLETMVPDLILLDITMPRMDGYQACKNIRSKSSTKDVPIVMISGKDGFFDKVRGRMAGTTGYITKPFGPETLMKAVEMYLAGEAPDLDDEV
jgi:twitching motility two-component system response regulator PilG